MINKGLFLVFSLWVFPAGAVELSGLDFFVCLQKTAITVQARTLRVHQFPNKKKCAVIYSVSGQDKVIAQGGWLSFCKKTLKKAVQNLQKGLWECHSQKSIQTFYAFPQKSPKKSPKNSDFFDF